MTSPDSNTASNDKADNAAVVIERRDAVLIARINRPDARNSLNSAVIGGLGSALLAAEEDSEIRALVLTGTGDRAFCAGMDLREFASGGAGAPESADGKRAADAFTRLAASNTTIPVIGAANATAVGGGLELLSACDLIVASTAAKFALPEAKRGLFAAAGGTSLGNRIALGVVLELLLTGEPITAERAERVGLVNVLAEPDQVLETAIALATTVAANAPLGLAASKELARLAVTDPTAVPERRKHWQKTVFTSADAAEGATAFIERRTPNWQGK
ncbi:MAG: enoyl-CoA hydratase/isomerase family protein [Nocardia sp.]|nr:enoyl-CoA hydratase/isomerase family protein [Nocardia sp.]